MVEAGYNRADLLGEIDRFEILSSNTSFPISDEIKKRSVRMIEENKDNPNFFDGDKIGVESIKLSNNRSAKISISKGRTYSQLKASHAVFEELDPNGDMNPIKAVYRVPFIGKNFRRLDRKNPHSLNILAQGALVALDCDGSVATEDLVVPINVRSQAVGAGKGLRHYPAGFADLGKGFEGYDFGTAATINSMYGELEQELGITPDTLVNGVVPVALSQDRTEVHIQYISLVKLDKDMLMKRAQEASDKWEADKWEFPRLSELAKYAEDHKMYSHSDPLLRNQEMVIRRFSKMRGD